MRAYADAPVAWRTWRALAIAVLAVLALIEMGLSAAIVAYPGEVMYGEAILYGHARRLLEGVALYQPVDRFPYAVTSYPPVFYAIAAVLQRTVGEGFAPGRVVSLLATLGCAVLTGWLGMNRSRAWGVGLLAGLTFLALGVPGSGPMPWTALYKEDTFALLLALGSLLLVQRRGRARSSLVVAGGLGALAVLTKQTLGPMVLAPAIWLWLGCRDLRGALLFGVSFAVPVAVVSLALQAATGAFLQSVVLTAGGPSSLEWLRQNLQLLLLFQIGPLLAGGLYLWRGPRATDDGLLLAAWIGAALPLLALVRVGGASNHWMMWAALTAVFAARAVWTSRTASMAFVAGTLVSLVVAGTAWSESLGALRSSEDLNALYERARSIEPTATVLSDPLDVAVLSGHEPLFEPLAFNVFYADGRWSTEPVLQEICAGQVALVVLRQPLDEVDWPRPVVDALVASMRLEDRTGDRLVYVPTMPGAPGC